MANTTLTFEMQGDVPLREFALGMDQLRRLVEALEKEINRKAQIEWIIEDLRPGSTLTTIRGDAPEIESVERVVHAYAVVGKSLQNNRPVPYQEPVRRHAHALMKILGSQVTAIRFETADEDAIIVSGQAGEQASSIASYGAVEGKVETLSSRRSLRFVLYDRLHGRAVACYLAESQKEDIRELWDRDVVVEGLVTRDAATGRPIAIRHITNIRPISISKLGGYRAARGVIPLQDDQLLAEDAVRRLRDA